MEQEDKIMTKYKCACCGEYTLTMPTGYYDECDNCGWVDNHVQNKYIDFRGGPNKISLREAQEIYKKAIKENLNPYAKIQKADRYAREHWNAEEEEKRLFKLYPEIKQKVEESRNKK